MRDVAPDLRALLAPLAGRAVRGSIPCLHRSAEGLVAARLLGRQVINCRAGALQSLCTKQLRKRHHDLYPQTRALNPFMTVLVHSVGAHNFVLCWPPLTRSSAAELVLQTWCIADIA